MRQKISLTLRTKIVIIVILTTFIFILTTSSFVSYNVAQNQKQNIKNEITSTATIVANNIQVQRKLAAKIQPTKNNYLQRYTHTIAKVTKSDFIVIINNNFIRYSHSNTNYIGKKFSSIDDAKKSINGHRHYSHHKGILGTGFRIFEPIFYKNKQVGIVCVGLTDKSINKAIWQAESLIILCSLFAFLIGINLTILLTNHIKKTLLGMEPSEIAVKLTELYAITNSTNEALIAINQQGVIITANLPAQKLFSSIKIGKKIAPALAKSIFPKKKSEQWVNKIIMVNSKELIISTNKLVYQNINYGQMALLRDQSDYQKLSEQLADTQQYIQALRAQSHEFLNKLQAIYGMIELKQYSAVDKFIQQVNHDYQQEFGQLNQQIGAPALVGFLIGKIRQANEQKVNLQITPDSYLPSKIISEQINLDLIKILGNLIDNSLEAINGSGQIFVALNYDYESQIIIVEVTDNGCGISSKVKQHILESNYSTKGINRGYGLALVNQIIKSHVGFLEILPHNPHGTEVYLELPIKQEEKNEI